MVQTVLNYSNDRCSDWGHSKDVVAGINCSVHESINKYTNLPRKPIWKDSMTGNYRMDHLLGRHLTFGVIVALCNTCHTLIVIPVTFCNKTVELCNDTWRTL